MRACSSCVSGGYLGAGGRGAEQHLPLDSHVRAKQPVSYGVATAATPALTSPGGSGGVGETRPPPALTLWAHLLLWSPSVSPDPRAKPSVLSGCSFPLDKMVQATLSYLPGRERGNQKGREGDHRMVCYPLGGSPWMSPGHLTAHRVQE